MSRDELNRLYRTGADNSWTVPTESRKDWRLAADWLCANLPSGDVLDVGCFDGGFLAMLPPQQRRLGIEIHEGAADRARQLGVEIVGGDYSELEWLDATYDCITAFDVIEHTLDPLEFVTLLAGRLRPGGVLILATGNADALTWRLMNGAYWYCWLPEHVSFISPRWCRRNARSAGMQVETMREFSHGNASFLQATGELGKNLLYRGLPRFTTHLRRRLSGAARGRPTLAESPPSWMSARDHFFAVLRKL
jgi:2-polyprenyl-3-methyl-5-hydroxy-6-metoxy-1,4-benzoquinol methylase